MVYKVAGYWQSQQKKESAAAAGGAEAGAAGTGPLHSLVSFLQALTNADADGRIVVQPPAAQQAAAATTTTRVATPLGSSSSGGASGAGGQLKFVLLNAAAHFGAVVSEAHAVVLASGTLSPLESVLHLFPGLPPHRLHRFACGHVVGEER